MQTPEQHSEQRVLEVVNNQRPIMDLTDEERKILREYMLGTRCIRPANGEDREEEPGYGFGV